MQADHEKTLKDSFTHRIQRLGGSTYLEISGSGFTLSINLGNVDPANKAQVAAAIEQQAKDAEFNAEKHLRRAKRLRAVLTTTELE